MIPVWGWTSTAAKFAYKTVSASGKKITLVFARTATGITFGDRGVLRRVMRPLVGENAHHIIPWARCDHEVVQAAATIGWHPSHPENGINLLESLHLSPSGSFNAHPQYDNMIEDILNDWAAANAGYTPTQAFDKLNEIVDQVRAAIAAHPTTHINNITIP